MVLLGQPEQMKQMGSPQHPTHLLWGQKGEEAVGRLKRHGRLASEPSEGPEATGGVEGGWGVRGH